MRGTISALALAGCLGGCGTYVPELREWPNYSQADTQNMIDGIVQSVRCELRKAVTRVVDNELREARGRIGGRTYVDFLDQWGAEVTFTFTIVEKGGATPSVLWTPPSTAASVFTLGGSLSVSSQATRVEKMNFFYTIAELYLRRGQDCHHPPERYDSFLIQNDLKIADLLYGRIGPAVLGTGKLPEPGRQNVLSHQITFQVVSTGSIAPSLKLVRATFDPSGDLLSATRDRTHDLLITFGPLDKAHGGKSLIAIAEQSHFTSQITSGFRTAPPR